MSSVLAIISKAVFEKMAPKSVAVGDLVPTDRYTSKHKSFETLNDGGALFLVTVRPPDERLWLVAILESPRFSGDAWEATNATPIADVTAAIKKLKFSTGQGIQAKPGALGMSLQTPRLLTSDDEALLRGLAGSKAAPAAKKSAALVAKKKPEKAMTLANYRKPLQTKLSAKEKKQLSLLLEQEGFGTIDEAAENEEATFELVDVVRDGKAVYQLYLWPFGSAALFRDGTTKVVGGAAQHHFDLEEGTAKDLAALEAAFEDAEALGVQETLTFAKAPLKKKKSPLDGATVEERLALIAKGNDWTRAAANSIAKELWGDAWVPYPKRAFAELEPVAKKLVERVADAGESEDLFLWGFPCRGDHIKRFAGRLPAGPSDAVMIVNGAALPAWIAFSRVGSGHLEAAPVVAAFRALPGALAAWTEMATGEAYDLLTAQPWQISEYDNVFNARSIEYHTRLFRALADANHALGDKGLAAARKIIRSIPENEGGTSPMWIAVLSLARHEPGSPELDALIPRFEDWLGGRRVVPPIVKELVAQLPGERAAAVRAQLKNKLYLK